MPALSNPRRELYAQLRAGGKKKSEAYAGAGFSGKGKAQSANRLEADAQIGERIRELCALAEQIPQAANWLNRNFVLEGLRKVFVRAMELDKLGDAIRALELCGKELGLFIDRSEHRFAWDGDPSKLDDSQLEKLTNALEGIAYGQDEARKRQEQRRVLSEAGAMTVELEPADGLTE